MHRIIPTISVVIPTYNRAHVVGEAIQSVLHQTYQDFDIIVVDDASNDNTEAVVKGFDDSRIFYLRHRQNRGAPWARNSGAEATQGDYLAFLDSDDRWYPEFLERQLTAFVDLPSDVGMICCGMIRTQGDSQRIMRPRTRDLTFDGNLMRADGICTSSFLVRRTAFWSIGGFDVAYSSFQDFDFLLRMAARYRIEAIDNILLEYRLGEDSISVNMASKASGFERVIDNYKRDILRLGLMHRYLFRLGQYHVLSGCLKTGWQCWIRGLRCRPLDVKLWKHFLLTLGGVGPYRRVLALHQRRVQR